MDKKMKGKMPPRPKARPRDLGAPKGGYAGMAMRNIMRNMQGDLPEESITRGFDKARDAEMLLRMMDESSTGMMKGGKVKGYAKGGMVCRGGGSAERGTKFRGVK